MDMPVNTGLLIGAAQRKQRCIWIAAGVVWILATALHAQVANKVDPFLGIDGGGNTIPGPSMPFGMIKPGPDVGAN